LCHDSRGKTAAGVGPRRGPAPRCSPRASASSPRRDTGRASHASRPSAAPLSAKEHRHQPCSAMSSTARPYQLRKSRRGAKESPSWCSHGGLPGAPRTPVPPRQTETHRHLRFVSSTASSAPHAAGADSIARPGGTNRFLKTTCKPSLPITERNLPAYSSLPGKRGPARLSSADRSCCRAADAVVDSCPRGTRPSERAFEQTLRPQQLPAPTRGFSPPGTPALQPVGQIRPSRGAGEIFTAQLDAHGPQRLHRAPRARSPPGLLPRCPRRGTSSRAVPHQPCATG